MSRTPFRLGYALTLFALTLAFHATADQTFEDAQRAWDAGELEEANSILTSILRETPRDIRVNFLLGQVALKRGKNSHAAFAFERVLALQPGNHRARLELARAYYLMGQHLEARQLFETVRSSEPPEEVRRHIDAYLEAIERADRRWWLSGDLNVSVFYDDNVNYGPADEEIDTVLGTLLVAPPARAAETTGIALSAGGRAVYDPGVRQDWQLLAAASGYKSWLEEETDQEILFGRISAGMQHASAVHLLRIEGLYDHLDYGGSALLDSYGTAVRWNRAVARDWITECSGRVEQRDYADFPERDAVFGEVRASAQRTIDRSRYRFSVTGGGFQEQAETDGFSNTGWLAELGATASLPLNLTAYVTTGYRFTTYEDVLLVGLQTEPREDDQWQLSTGLQAKLGPQTGLDLNYRFIDNNSNFGLYGYERNVVTLGTSIQF